MTTGRTPQDYLMNPGKHAYITKYEKMSEVLDVVRTCAKSIQAQLDEVNICIASINYQLVSMYEKLSTILPEDGIPPEKGTEI